MDICGCASLHVCGTWLWEQKCQDDQVSPSFLPAEAEYLLEEYHQSSSSDIKWQEVNFSFFPPVIIVARSHFQQVLLAVHSKKGFLALSKHLFLLFILKYRVDWS